MARPGDDEVWDASDTEDSIQSGGDNLTRDWKARQDQFWNVCPWHTTAGRSRPPFPVVFWCCFVNKPFIPDTHRLGIETAWKETTRIFRMVSFKVELITVPLFSSTPKAVLQVFRPWMASVTVAGVTVVVA